MKSSMNIVIHLLVMLLLVQNSISAMRMDCFLSDNGHQDDNHGRVAWPSKIEGGTVVEPDFDFGEKKPKVNTVQVAGSRLPDCSHACGSCTPCRLVIVSLACPYLAEAETCPISYRCMCNNKSYSVP